jgi:hypothetical protein
VRGKQEECILPHRALAEGMEYAIEMPQDTTLPLQGESANWKSGYTY